MTWLVSLGLSLALLATPAEKPSKALTLDMHERFAYAAMMRTALIHGYAGRARRHARQLHEVLQDADSQAVAALALRAAEAESVNDLALAVAQVGEACGACHEKNRVRPQFLGATQAPKGDSLVARMGRHIWAADRMWEGLIAHSPDTWQRGAKALSRESIFHADDGTVPADRVAAVQEIARRASQPQPWARRAAVYGEFLAACSGCHQAYLAVTDAP